MSVGGGLAALAERWHLDPHQERQLAAILAALAEDAQAPTAVREEPAAIDVHLADSLSGLALPSVRDARAIADLGSGAGFPGAVLAIALPHARVALVESGTRKCAYLERLCERAEIANARAVCARAEEWREEIGAHDLVVARALAPLAVLCEYASPLLGPGGALVAWKGAVTAAEEAAGARAAELLGMRPFGTVRADPYAGSVAHRLVEYRKIAATPAGFPRRAGVARRRPLGGTG